MEESKVLLATLVFPTRPHAVLLGYKKRGFGQGKYTGFGGKVEPGETPVECAARELAEESSLRVPAHFLKPAAVLDFIFPYQPAWDMQVHTFLASQWSGEPTESAEMRPEWFDVSAIPFDCMWHDNRFWLPRLLAGETLKASFTFQEDNATVQEIFYGMA
jgi:8-oxo-dGTP diphosphatase